MSRWWWLAIAVAFVVFWGYVIAKMTARDSAKDTRSDSGFTQRPPGSPPGRRGANQ